MKKALFVSIFLIVPFSVYAETPADDKPEDSPAVRTFLDLPFKAVEAAGGWDCLVFFRDVAVENNLKDVSVNIDSVTVLLIQSNNSYATLDLHDAFKNTDGWVIAKSVTVIVRQEADRDAWRKYLLKKKAERDERRKKLLEPVRVLPPEDLSP